MVDVRIGDKVVVHGRALVDGLTIADGYVAGIGADGSTINATIFKPSGAEYNLPATAKFGPTDDGADWWEFPKDSLGRPITPNRD